MVVTHSLMDSTERAVVVSIHNIDLLDERALCIILVLLRVLGSSLQHDLYKQLTGNLRILMLTSNESAIMLLSGHN